MLEELQIQLKKVRPMIELVREKHQEMATLERRLKYFRGSKSSKEYKELKSDNIKLLDPDKKRYRAMRMEMLNKQNGRRSIFNSDKVSFAPGTKDEYFTERYLERP